MLAMFIALVAIVGIVAYVQHLNRERDAHLDDFFKRNAHTARNPRLRYEKGAR